MQLFVARNRRRINARNYKGVAKITCRWSRKGFDLKFNPDSHIGLLHFTEVLSTSNTRKIATRQLLVLKRFSFGGPSVMLREPLVSN